MPVKGSLWSDLLRNITIVKDQLTVYVDNNNGNTNI